VFFLTPPGILSATFCSLTIELVEAFRFLALSIQSILVTSCLFALVCINDLLVPFGRSGLTLTCYPCISLPAIFCIRASRSPGRRTPLLDAGPSAPLIILIKPNDADDKTNETETRLRPLST